MSERFPERVSQEGLRASGDLMVTKILADEGDSDAQYSYGLAFRYERDCKRFEISYTLF
jgi:hypothetical protein